MSKQTRQAAPPYSEEQVTRWLPFLARGMTEHDQTIFLIENLQPSWLTARWQRWVYTLASRLAWGVLSWQIIILIIGLTYILVGFPIVRAMRVLIGGLIIGLIGGLIVGLSDIIWTSNKYIQPKQTMPFLLRNLLWGAAVMLIGRLIGGIIGELVAGLILVLYVGLVGGLSVVLISMLIAGPVLILRGYRSMRENEIETVEIIRFMWVLFPEKLKTGLKIGLFFGLTTVWLNGAQLDLGPSVTRLSRLSNGLIFAIIFGLSTGILWSFQTIVRQMKTTANQGICFTLRSAGLMGGIGGVAFGLTVRLLIYDWMIGVAYGLVSGLCIGLWYGGLDVIQHFLVRFLLWRAGSLPWRLAPFLDYAAEELNFLQKVGGGYIFVHRYLLEHFAAMETDDGRPRTADG